LEQIKNGSQIEMGVELQFISKHIFSDLQETKVTIMILDFKVRIARWRLDKIKSNINYVSLQVTKTSPISQLLFSLWYVLYFWLKRGRRLKSHEPSWCFSSS